METKLPGMFLAKMCHLYRILATDSYYDSPPKKPAIFFNERFMAARHKERMQLKTNYPYVFLCAKAYRSMTSGRVSRDTVFQEIRPGAGFETGDFVKKSWGCYRRTNLLHSCTPFVDDALVRLCVPITRYFLGSFRTAPVDPKNNRDVYGVSTAPRSIFFLFFDLAERMPARGKSHGLSRSGYPPLQISRITMERISAFEYVTERSGYLLAGKVTDCHGADIRRYKCHGLLRSGYVFFHGAVYLTPWSKTVLNRGISPRCTVAIIR